MGVSAATITGHIGFGGSVVYDTLAPTPSADATIDFYDEQTGLPDKTLGGGNGQVLRVGPTSGYFTGLSGYAEIKDITNAASDQPPSLLVIPGFNYGPAGLQFLSNFTGMAGLEFDLTRLDTQGGATCTGAESGNVTCVEGPFVLTGTDNGIRISFDVHGFFRRGIDEGYYKGSFATTFNGLTFTALWAKLAAGEDIMCGVNNAELACTLDANFDPDVIPEPATVMSFGLGSALLALAVRRRAAKANKA